MKGVMSNGSFTQKLHKQRNPEPVSSWQRFGDYLDEHPRERKFTLEEKPKGEKQ